MDTFTTYKTDVHCIGELLVDFLPEDKGKPLQDVGSFTKYAGGAPANLAVGLARLGLRSGFIGRVGDDPFGYFLRDELKRAGVQIDGISFDKEYKTRLAFVSLSEAGDRSFTFWESNPADIHLMPGHIDRDLLRQSAIVHISSFLLLHDPARSSIFEVISELRDSPITLSFDPNIRLDLWKRPERAKQLLIKMIKFVNILRLNVDEAIFLSGKDTIEAAARKLLAYGPEIVVITKEDQGCYYKTASANGFVNGFRVEAIDTTGCGDGFMAGLLRGAIKNERNMRRLEKEELHAILRYANAVGAIVATKPGAISALPTHDEVVSFLSTAESA
jgi:fructokinase